MTSYRLAEKLVLPCSRPASASEQVGNHAYDHHVGKHWRAQELDRRPVSVSYLINRLQPLPFKTPVMVSLNPQREPEPAKVIAAFDYAHPIFDGPAIAAQRELPTISGDNRVWFCGAWNGYGFHEDGLKSALQVANALACRAPWQGHPVSFAEKPAVRLKELAA